MLTDLTFLEPGAPWPPPSEAERLQRYDENRLLFEGDHEQVFSEAFKRLMREEDMSTIEFVLNWPKRLSTLWADLLLGETPEINAGETDSEEQRAVDRIIEENDLWNTAYEAAIDVSRFGTGVLKARYERHGVIEAVPPSIWFPVVDPLNIKRATHHVLAWTYGPDDDQRLRVEIHEPGRIEYRTYDMAGGSIGKELERDEEATGVEAFLVRPVHNLLTSDRNTGLDDYTDLDSIVQELAVRIGQMSRILDKHSDPNMYGDEAALEQDDRGNWVFRGGGKFFPVQPGGTTPGYVTWDGQLDAQLNMINLLMEQFYALSETSPAAFGQLKAGLAESGSALKRLLLAPLAKVNRVRMRMDPALKDMIRVASWLEKAQSMRDAVALESLSITWQDGLPDDDKEETEIAVMRVDAGILSPETAVERLDGLTGEQLEEEMARIANHQAQGAAPSFGMTPFSFGVTGATGEGE